MTVTHPEPEAQYHDVVRGDTLSAIAKKFYGDANKYPVIFEANKPMLTHPGQDLPGSKTAHSRAVIAPCQHPASLIGWLFYGRGADGARGRDEG